MAVNSFFFSVIFYLFVDYSLICNAVEILSVHFHKYSPAKSAITLCFVDSVPVQCEF